MPYSYIINHGGFAAYCHTTVNYYRAPPLCACSPTTPGLRLLNPTAPSMHLQLRRFQPWPKTFIFLPSTGTAPPWCFQFSALCVCVLWARAKVPDWLAGTDPDSQAVGPRAAGLGWHQGHRPTGDTLHRRPTPQNTHRRPRPRTPQEDIMFHACMATHTELWHPKSNRNARRRAGVIVAFVRKYYGSL